MIRIKEPKKRTLESSVLQAVKQYLQQVKGYYVIRIQQSLGSHRGLTDLIAIKDGKVLFIEVKSNSSRSKQSPHQVEFQREIEAHGGTYMLVRSVEEIIYAQI